MQNPVPVGNPSIQNSASAPENDLISFDESQLMHQPAQLREENMPAVDLLTDDIPNIKAGPSSIIQGEQKKKSVLMIDELIKWLTKPGIKNNKKIRSNPIPKTNEEWYDLMETNNEDSEPSDSKYDTTDEDPNIYFEKIKDPYINRISETEKFNKREHETIEIIREDRINATIEKGYNEIIDQIEDEAIQESGWSFVQTEEVFLEISAFRPLRGSNYLPLSEALDKPQLGLINLQNNDDNECFKWCISAYHTREEVLKANRKPPHLNEIRRLRQNANIANFNNINFLATLYDIDKFEENNSNYAINIFMPVYKEVFRKIKVDINSLHISKRNYQVKHMIDLLYLTKDFTRLMHKWNNYYGPSKASQHLIFPEEEAKEIEAEEKDKEGNTIKEAKQIARKYQTTNKCWICEEKLHESGYNKIRVFDPETKKYLGASHRKYYGKKELIRGKWKDENADIRVTGYVGVRAKCYSVITKNPQKNMIKAKSLKKSLIKKELIYKIFEDYVLEGKEDQPQTAQFLRSYRH
ncbi:9700_t:CDS:2 [Acaulospora morrowiae]|uniref:9700_t:CDS:1 n=1 Tax=Acaulospora morrowiae TaxID=94023 RepID=A0A9N8VQG1_9GLOM|nr:9700_t:CDS:2 [Acaulospora morrowiae]